MKYRALLLLACMIFAGCTSLPAQVPPQLQNTPGSFIVVEDGTLHTPSFWVDAPAKWKIVKSSIAADPIVLVFAAPNDEMTITVSEAPLSDGTIDADVVVQQDNVTLSNGQTVYLSGRTKQDRADSFKDIFSDVRDSIRLPQ